MRPFKGKKACRYRGLWVPKLSRMECLESFPLDTAYSTYKSESDIVSKLKKEEYIQLSSILLKHGLLYDKRRDEILRRKPLHEFNIN